MKKPTSFLKVKKFAKKHYKKTIVAVLVALLLGFGYNQFAHSKDRVVEVNGMTLTLTDKPCSNKTVLQLADMAGLPPELRKDFKQGKGKQEDVKAEICYVENPQNKNEIFVIDELGGMGNLELPGKK